MGDLPPPVNPERFLISPEGNEDAAVLRFPDGRALVQTLDLLTPVVNDPYRFGRIAAANALSDIYAMGGEPWCAMNIVCFPLSCQPQEVLHDILMGGADALREAGASLAGGHSIEDPEVKYGLSVTGLVDPDKIAANSGLKPGDCLFLTKPLGTGVLSTAVKAQWEGSAEHEDEIFKWAGRLQIGAANAIRRLHIKAATDVTGFGLAGHCLEMARASRTVVRLRAQALPLMRNALDMASMGLVPVGAHANREFCGTDIHVSPDITPALRDLAFDPQTSGGMLLAVRPEQREQLLAVLAENGDQAWEIGTVERSVAEQPGDAQSPGTPLLYID